MWKKSKTNNSVTKFRFRVNLTTFLNTVLKKESFLFLLANAGLSANRILKIPTRTLQMKTLKAETFIENSAI